MAQFEYRALNKEGQVVTGMMNGSDLRAVARKLRLQNLTPVNLTLKNHKPHRAYRRPKARDTLLVIEQLGILLKSGVTLDESVESLAQAAEQPIIQQSLDNILKDIKRGRRFSETLGDSLLNLPEYVLQLVRAGETIGNIAGALTEAAKHMAYEERIARDIRTALIYPSILIITGIVAILLIFWLVVPRFSSLLSKSDTTIPWLASLVLKTGEFFNQWPELIIGTFAFLCISTFLVLRIPQARQRFRDKITQLPLLGPWLLETDMSRWATMLATLLSSRVDLIQALELSQQGVKSSLLSANLAHVTKAVRSGSSLARALQASQAISPTGLGLVRVGEKSGNLASMLDSLANMYTENARERAKRFLALLEPAAILVIGSIIGVIMTGIILAITSVNDIAM